MISLTNKGDRRPGTWYKIRVGGDWGANIFCPSCGGGGHVGPDNGYQIGRDPGGRPGFVTPTWTCTCGQSGDLMLAGWR